MKRKIKNVILSLSISAIMLIPITAMARPIDVKPDPDCHRLHSRWIKLYRKSAGWAETSWPGAIVETEVWFPQSGYTVSRRGKNYSKTPDVSGEGRIFSQYDFIDTIYHP